jgi:hypothetical protein
LVVLTIVVIDVHQGELVIPGFVVKGLISTDLRTVKALGNSIVGYRYTLIVFARTTQRCKTIDDP